MLGLGNNISSALYRIDDPSSFNSALLAWWKYDVGVLNEIGSPITSGDLDLVHTWQDQSGNGEHLTVNGSNNALFNATNSAIYFDDTTDVYDFTTAGGVTFAEDSSFAMYFRIKFTGTVNNGDKFILDGSNEFWRMQSATSHRVKIRDDAQDFNIGVTVGTSAYYNMGLERDLSGLVQTYVDGTATTYDTGSSLGTQTNTNPVNFDQIGKGMVGYVRQIIIINRSLSSLERADLQTYLAAI